jgi:ABC-type multidrug transport system fused ATPase/permease subunit
MLLLPWLVWIINGHWTIGSLLAFQAYLAYVFGQALILASGNLQLQNARAALEHISAVFDITPEDPTSALDSHTEISILDALPSRVKGKTVIVASHRPSTIMQADRIILLNENGISDVRLPESLMESNDYYRSMVGDQNDSHLADREQDVSGW